MIVLKSIGGLVVGFVVGYLGGGIAGLVYAIATNAPNFRDADLILQSCTLIGAIIGLGTPIVEESQRRSRVAKEKRRQLQLQREDVQRRIEHLATLLSASQDMFSSIRQLIPLAERYLSLAEREFAEGAFAPFWDEIEAATNALARYQQGIKTINSNALIYAREASIVPTQVPRFDLPTQKLPDGRPLAMRLAAMVRKAQKDFHFAMIYEQRKTNKILVEGFGTLASAIYSIADQISYSLNDLSNSLHTSLDEIVESEKRQEGMLDNIQRGRKTNR